LNPCTKRPQKFLDLSYKGELEGAGNTQKLCNSGGVIGGDFGAKSYALDFIEMKKNGKK